MPVMAVDHHVDRERIERPYRETIREIQEIVNSEDLTPREKREQIDSLCKRRLAQGAP